MCDVTRILSEFESGDPSAAEQLLPLVYRELRRLAAAQIAHEKPGQTLQATALVHEAYIRLVDTQEAQQWASRGHFFSAASEAMRRILVECARRKGRKRHGGGKKRYDLAEQKEPVERRVAFKIIKPGMDTQQVIARFKAEEQALAMMDQTNIAKVLEVGTTDSGRPYFAMELIRGIPITQYCDKHCLTPRERLELFVPVCHAIQHAHQKGVIHRDIKPTNVMVAEYDDRPVPKIIDFGVVCRPLVVPRSASVRTVVR